VLEQAWLIEPDWTRPHLFEQGRYPAPVGSRYAGRYDFVKHFFPVLADLKNGRIAVIEFKGAHLTSEPYEIEKKQVGLLWAGASQGKAVFDWALMLRDGLSLSQQLDKLLG
jgi:type III restriction enzyme